MQWGELQFLHRVTSTRIRQLTSEAQGGTALNKTCKTLMVAGAITAASFLSSSAFAQEQAPDFSVNVQIDNELVNFPDAKPFIDQNQRTQVPIRFVSEKLGYHVDWVDQGESVKVVLKSQDKEIVLQTGDNKAIVNGQTVTLDTQAALYQDRTYVPVHFVAEALGNKVQWDANAWTAMVLTGKGGDAVKPVLASRSSMSLVKKPDTSVVDVAVKYQGVPYVWGGTSPAGFDCSGFVNFVFAQKGIKLPRTAAEIYKVGIPVTDLQPGDLVFYSTYAAGASHVGIYLGNNQFISATSSSGVKVVPLSNSYWAPRYVGAKRL